MGYENTAWCDKCGKVISREEIEDLNLIQFVSSPNFKYHSPQVALKQQLFEELGKYTNKHFNLCWQCHNEIGEIYFNYLRELLKIKNQGIKVSIEIKKEE